MGPVNVVHDWQPKRIPMMNTSTTRREFVKTLLAGAAGLSLLPQTARSASEEAFAFLLLGDLRFDKLECHDLEFLRREKPEDLRQVREDSSLTNDMLPRLFGTVRKTIAGLNRSPETSVAFTVQVGDLVEGLSGSAEQARQLDAEAPFVRRFQYADLPGYVVIRVNSREVTASVCSGVGRSVWRNLALSELLKS
jgi:hypothetical protein